MVSAAARAGVRLTTLRRVEKASGDIAAAGVAAAGLAWGAAIAVGVSIVAALATSIVPTWTAASRPPIRSLTTGG